MIKRARTNSGTAAIRSKDDNPEPRDNWVATIPLKDLLNRIVHPPTRPVLIKIDVEGFEPEVLVGLDFDGPFRPKNILMEFDPQLAMSAWESPDRLQSFFAARNYDVLDVFGNPLRDLGSAPEQNVWARDRRADRAES